MRYEHSLDETHWTMCCYSGYSGYGACPVRYHRTAKQAGGTGQRAADWLRSVADLVETKSKSYGDSVGDPIKIFSRSAPEEGIRSRIDDKLKRIKNGSDSLGDNDLQDLVGYVALLAVVNKA